MVFKYYFAFNNADIYTHISTIGICAAFIRNLIKDITIGYIPPYYSYVVHLG